jgi:hypothetical protein
VGQSLPLWVREAAQFEPEGDHIICRWHGTEWIMSPAVAHMVAANLGRALQQFHTGQSRKDAIVPFKELG